MVMIFSLAPTAHLFWLEGERESDRQTEKETERERERERDSDKSVPLDITV
jgi:hypothetical protein